MLSAIKRAEKGKKLIVRFYNNSADHVEGRLSSFFPLMKAQIVKLNEEPGENLCLRNQHAITFEAHPWQIITMGLSIQPFSKIG